MAKSVSPPLAHRALVQQHQPLQQQRLQSSTSKLAKYQVPRYPEEVVLRQQGSSNKPILQRSSISYAEPTTDDKKKENNVNGKCSIASLCHFIDFMSFFIVVLFFSSCVEKETAFVTLTSSLSLSKNSTTESNCTSSDSKTKLMNRNSSSMDSNNGPGCSSSS